MSVSPSQSREDASVSEVARTNRHFKRSNALRIKSNNLELLPYPLNKSFMALRQSRLKDSNNEEAEEAELGLLEQIKRGVKLKPVRRDRARNQSFKNEDDENEQSNKECHDKRVQSDEDNSTVSAILFRVLKQRYRAVQQTDDEDSELSSIESCHAVSTIKTSDDLFLIGYGDRNSVNCCVLYGPVESHRCGLLERFAGLEHNANGSDARELINDLTVRL